MNWINKIGRAALFAAIICLFGVSAQAQKYSNTATVNVDLSVNETLTVSATPSTVNLINYSSSAGTAAADNTITVSTLGSINGTHAWITTSAWFASASAALSGPQNVPSSAILASVDGGSLNPCTAMGNGSVPIPGMVSGAACASTVGYNANFGSLSFQQTPPAGLYTATDTIALSLTGETNLNPGSYAGVLTIEAGAF